MTSTRPEVVPLARYSMKDTYLILQISYSTLKRLVRNGCIKKRYHLRTGHPYFLGKDILALWDGKM